MKNFNNASDGIPQNFYATRERRDLKSDVVYVKRENLSRAMRRNFDRINKKEK